VKVTQLSQREIIEKLDGKGCLWFRNRFARTLTSIDLSHAGIVGSWDKA
jgi:hypothetical protein